MVDLGKQAISPLIATVLLVAFSIAIGAVVMSWGEEYVAQKAEFVSGVREAISSCDAVSLTAVRINNVLQACVRGNSVELTLDNGADTDIFDVYARLVGVGGTFSDESLLNAPLKRLYAAKLAIPFPAPLAPMRQVKLVPKVKVGNDVIFCRDQSLVLENFRKC